jgi:MFS family permease
VSRRLLLAILFLLAVETLERTAFYGAKSILRLWMVSDLSVEPANATEAIHLLTRITYSMPFLGALIAVGIGPRFTLAMGGMLASIGLAMLTVAETLEMIRWSFVVLAVGGGLMKPAIVAALADALPDPRETARNILFVCFYGSINFGSFVGTLLAPAFAREGLSRALFGSAALVTLLAALLALTFAILWRFLKDPKPEEPSREAWWPPALGSIALALFVIPVYVVIDFGTVAIFRATPAAEGAGFLAGLNPVFVLITCVFVLVGLAGALAAGYRIRGLLLIGVGMTITAVGAVPMLVAPSEWGAVAVTIAVMAVGETLVGAAVLSRVVSGHHWRAKAIFAAIASTAVVLANVPSWFVHALPRNQQDTASVAVLASAVLLSALLGIALAAMHVPLSRLLWSESEEGTGPDTSATNGLLKLA